MKSSAAEVPWSNGIIERHNAVPRKIIKKLQLDNNNTYPIDVIVSWAISAKNALQSCYGFSPNELVFGKSANLPSNLVTLPPAMEDVSHADILAKHLNTLHAARKAFIKAESSDKLQRALKAKNRETTGIEFEIGDMVYYKRNSSDKWRGLGTVIGKENKHILVKHDGYYIRVHRCSLPLISNNVCIPETLEKGKNPDDSNKDRDEKLVEKDYSIISDDESEFYPSSKECETESLPVNENDDINTLPDSLNDLPISASGNSDISNPIVLNNILPKVKSTVLYHNQIIIDGIKL